MSQLRDGPWPLGAFQAGETEQIPAGGAARLYDGLWDEQGAPYRRGGSVYKSSSALSPIPRWIKDVRLAGGQRTAFANTTELSSLDSNDTSLLTVDANDPQTAIAPVTVRGALFWVTTAASVDTVRGWAGSRKTGYSTGTVALTAESRTVTGTGTTWTTNVDVGSILLAGTVPTWGIVESVVSNTSITLTEPWTGVTESGIGYTIGPVAAAGWSGLSARIAALGSVAGRLLVARGAQLQFSRIDVSAFAAFTEDDLHVLPGLILGIGNIRDTAIVFTTEGTYGIYNMALDLTGSDGSPQQRMERINDELILLGQHGLANWEGRIIAPMLDGVWVISATDAPQKISQSFQDQYQSHVRAGYVPGSAAVFNGHYFLPIVTTAGNAIDLMTCRLTPNSAGRAMLWSQHRGHGGGDVVNGVAARAPTAAGVAPVLLSAGDDGKISTLRHFEPAAAYKADADGVAQQLRFDTRSFETGRNRSNFVDQVTVHYTLTDAASDNPTIDLGYALDGNSTFTDVSGTGSESSGTIAKRTWRVGRMARTIQIRLRTANAAATAKIRSIEIKTRDSARP